MITMKEDSCEKDLSKRTRVGVLVKEFLQESTLHGVKHLGGIRDRHIVERIFWAIAVSFFFGFSILVVENLYSRYNESPVIISFQPMETSVSSVPFPAITICNVNILKGKVIKTTFLNAYFNIMMFPNTFFKDVNLQKDVVRLDHVSHFCLASPSFRRSIKEPLYDSEGEKDFVEGVENTLNSFNETYNELLREWHMKFEHESDAFLVEASNNCSDMILKCMWARKIVPCKKYIFEIATRHGHCCVFNMMPEYILRIMEEDDKRVDTEKDYLPDEAEAEWERFDVNKMIGEAENGELRKYPKYQMAGGKPYGLSLVLNPDLEQYSTCATNDGLGFKMAAHPSISFPSVVDYGMAIPPNREIFVEVEPQVIISDGKDLSSIPVGKRGCLLPTDKDAELETYNFYTASNCLDECIAKLTFQNCSCVRFYMSRNSTQSLCGAQKLKCAEEVLANITASGKAEQCSNCWPSCTDINYRMQMSTFPLRENTSLHFYNGQNNANNTKAANYSIMHIYIGTSSLYAMERKPLYTKTDLLSNAGGLLSLTLGFSMISLVEIIYYCTLRPLFKIWKRNDQEFDEDDMSKKTVVPQLNSTDYYKWAMKARIESVQAVTQQINVMPAPRKDL